MDIDWDAVRFFTDSRIVLGYIHNTTRRFHMYVSNRVSRIRQTTHPDQWFYISSEKNPADHTTRPTQAALLSNTNWFSVPAFLTCSDSEELHSTKSFVLVDPEEDIEIRPAVTTLKTNS